MKPRVYKLIHLVAAIVLLASLGLSAAPGKTASFACDPTFVRRNGKVFTVLPSGGDDTANLTCAFEAAKAAGKAAVLATFSIRRSLLRDWSRFHHDLGIFWPQ